MNTMSEVRNALLLPFGSECRKHRLRGIDNSKMSSTILENLMKSKKNSTVLENPMKSEIEESLINFLNVELEGLIYTFTLTVA